MNEDIGTDHTVKTRYLRLFVRGARNYFTGRPLCVSFEITRRCNARCKHCHLGVPIKNEQQATAAEYGAICETVRPVVAQISGGEPLLRRDLEEIVAEIKRRDPTPYIVLTTNAILLTPERFRRLRRAGVDRFSVSLDYPDERHDEFRRVPGLFERIRSLVQEVRPEERCAIALSCVIQSDNFREAKKLAELARSWKVGMNFSAYTSLRTGDKKYLLTPDEVHEFKGLVDDLLQLKKQWNTVLTSRYVFNRMMHYFEHGSLPGCEAGRKFLIVNPDGTFSPCGLIMGNYETRSRLIREFSSTNTCSDCYTSIRANTEKPARYLILDSIGNL